MAFDRSCLGLVLFALALTAAPCGAPLADDATKGKTYTNDDLERKYGKPSPAQPGNGNRGGSSSAVGADRGQIEAALTGAASYYHEKAVKLAEGAVVWHQIHGCHYSGKYDVGTPSNDKVRARLHYECDGWNKDTQRAFRTKVSWPVQLERQDGHWSFVRRLERKR